MVSDVRKAVSVLDLTPCQVRNAMIVLVVLTFSKQFYMSSMTSYFTFFLMDKFEIDCA